MSEDNTAKELMRSIIALGKNLNLKIVAEGVETPQDSEKVKNMGCDLAQGFLYARPQSVEEIIALIKNPGALLR